MGSVLYAKNAPVNLESEWAALVQAVGGGDQGALHALFERAHRPVFTLTMRLTHNQQTAEELTLDVFHDVWRKASAYDPAAGTVLGWILNQARSRAIDRLRFERRKKRLDPGTKEWRLWPTPHDSEDALAFKQRAAQLRRAIDGLTPEESRAIETTYFSDLTHAEAAERLNEPLGTVKTRIRSGLVKLRRALLAEETR